MALQINNQAVEQAALRMMTLARSEGVPQDSMRRFIGSGYVPQPMQLRFHAAARACDTEGGPTQVGIGGARGPGKSHAVFAQIALDDCHAVPGLKVLYLRRISKNAREQFEDLRRSVLSGIAHDYNRSSGTLSFPNGSRIILGHFRTEGDVDQYLGLEYDVIAIEEATTLSLAKYRALRDSNRTSKPNWRPRIYSSTNPGGIGHAWYKALFIKPAREETETDTRFVFGTVEDNAFIDSGYRKKLEENTGWKLKAYRYGDWDIAAGQYFTTWRRDVHVKPTVKVMPGAAVWCALDYGFTHPTTCHLLTEYDGKTGVVDEYWKQKALVPQNAEGIKQMLDRNGIPISRLRSFVAGADVFANRGDEQGKTIADQYKERGIILTSANTDRINGAGQVLSLLGDVDAGIEPKLEIAERCTRLIECLPAMQHDPHRPEDVLKVDVDEDGNGGDDSYDDFRYGVMAQQRKRSPNKSYSGIGSI